MWKKVEPGRNKAPFAIQVENGSLRNDPYTAARWLGFEFDIHPHPCLAPHEHRTLVLGSFGLTAALTGDYLGLSLGTVKKYRETIFKKFNTNRMNGCVAIAVKDGVFDNVTIGERGFPILTSNEHETVGQKAQALDYDEVAKELCIAEATAKWRMHELYKRASLRNESSAVLYMYLLEQAQNAAESGDVAL